MLSNRPATLVAAVAASILGAALIRPSALRAQVSPEDEAAAGTLAPGWPPCRRTTDPSCEGKTAMAVRLPESEKLDIDGRPDEKAWGRAPAVEDFVQSEPREGALPTERTVVRFLYDDHALYVGARMFSDDPEAIRAVLARRDDDGGSQRLIVSLDSYQDRRTAYTFSVTAAGGRSDWTTSSDEGHRRDYSWDPVWTAAAHRDSLGWTAEMEIPFSQLRFNQADSLAFGMNLNRYIPRLNEDDFWVAVPRDADGWTSWFGDLEGLQAVRSHRPLELTPYVASSAEVISSELVDPDDPFQSTSDWSGRAGADLKAGIGPSLTLDATFNPDFGQVEADPAEVNLSAFPTFFQERRPFFVEREELLQANGLFYSRRIGAAPEGDVDADYVDIPGNTTILGAGKLTGRTPSGLSVGALAALTAAEHAKTYDAATNRTGEARVQPATGWAVLSLRQELGAGGSAVGLGATAVRRDLSLDDPLATQMNRQAYAGSGSWQLQLADGAYDFSGRVAGSWIEGAPEAIDRVQRFSSHYFQRPDADYLTYDPTRTSLSGYEIETEFERTTAEHWLWGVDLGATSPGYDINDAGRLRRADRIEAGGRLTYRENTPGDLFQRWNTYAAAYGEWNYGWERQPSSFEAGSELTFLSFWRWDLEVGLEPRAQSDVQTRGGPSMGTPRSWRIDSQLRNAFGARTQWEISAEYASDELGGWRFELDGELDTKPGGALQLSFDPSFSRRVDTRQYVRTFDGGSAATYGGRYVFGRIDRTTISMQIRAKYAFSPDLSLEGYAEPFAATGHYDRFGELEATGSRFLRVYGTDGTTIEESTGEEPHVLTVTDGEDSFSFTRPDFSSLSFRTNLVLRWEWRPGSTLFAIWQVDNGAFDRISDPRAARPGDLWDSVSTPGRNYLALKISYWLPI